MENFIRNNWEYTKHIEDRLSKDWFVIINHNIKLIKFYNHLFFNTKVLKTQIIFFFYDYKERNKYTKHGKYTVKKIIYF